MKTATVSLLLSFCVSPLFAGVEIPLWPEGGVPDEPAGIAEKKKPTTTDADGKTRIAFTGDSEESATITLTANTTVYLNNHTATFNDGSQIDRSGFNLIYKNWYN